MKRITLESAEKIKWILLNSYLDGKSIELGYENIKTTVSINGLTESEESDLFDDRNMEISYFLNNSLDDEFECININGRSHQLYMNIGQWGVTGNYQYEIPEMHFVLGTTSSKFGARDFFSQLEISQSLEDDTYIYIVKNISKLAGKGAIARLNSGLNDKGLKHERRNRLMQRLNTDAKFYEDNEWMIVSKVSKEDLVNEDMYNDIFYNMIKDILNYSFTIEDIIIEDKLLTTDK